MTNEESFNKAIAAYYRETERTGSIPQQPSTVDSNLIRGVWYLRNCNGFLARVGTRKWKMLSLR